MNSFIKIACCAIIVAGFAVGWLKLNNIGQLIETRAVHYQKFEREDEGYGYTSRIVTTDEQVAGKHAFAAAGRKAMYLAYVEGNSCKNLTGSFYLRNRGEGLTYGGAEGPLEKQWRREKAEQERTGKSDAAGKFYCIAPVKNIARYLEKGGQLSWDIGYTIVLKDGPVLLFIRNKSTLSSAPEILPVPGQNDLPKEAVRIGDMYAVAGKIDRCDDQSNDYCVPIDFYSYNYTTKKYFINVKYGGRPSGIYRIFCWDCEKFQNANKPLTSYHLVDLNIYRAFMLDGGLMVSDDAWKVTQRIAEEDKKQGIVQQPFEIGFLLKIRQLIQLSKAD